ncbi:PAS domain S-box protein [Archangium violaceum]|uniref:PAS domain S-box protein n=1 Tax=Archangium violaceum TaxID=83451 RepID=UPI00194EA59D|nr:PAS domain S-box protein [Archangium violaceum]QRN99621.1 PAS domain S-box protein [Archangium violaceum]
MSIEPQPPERSRLALADLLLARHEELVQRWLARLREGLAPGVPTRAELEDHIGDTLRELSVALRRHTAGGRSPGVRQPGGQRPRDDFDVQALVREYQVLHGCILDLVEETGEHLTLGEVRALGDFITTRIAEGVAESLRQHDAHPPPTRGALSLELTECQQAQAAHAALLSWEKHARQQAEEALALLDTLLTTAPVGLAFLDRNLRYVRINQMLADINGIPLEGTVGRHLREVIPELAAYLEPIYQRVLETGEPEIGVELSGITAGTGGEVRHWLVSHYPVHNAAGELLLLGSSVLDITDRKRAEEAQRVSEERFRLLVEEVEDYAIIMLDPEGRVVSWNAGAERINGYEAREVLGRHVSVFYTPEDVAAGDPDRCIQVAAERGHCRAEGLRVRKDGGRFWADAVITALRDEHGVLRGFSDVTRDISKRKQGEQALRETTQRLQAILETAVNGIITIDERGIIQNLNPATVHIFGYAPEELIGRNISILMPEPYRSEHDDYMTNYLRTGVRKVIGIGREVRGRRKDGSVFPLELAVSETRLPQGRFFTGLVRDISARKRAMEAQALFVEAGTLLSQSLDVATTLKKLASLAVSRLCDYCIVDLLGEDGQLHRLEVATQEQRIHQLILQTMAYAPPVANHGPLIRVLERGKAQAVPLVTPEWLDSVAVNAEHRALLEEIGPKSVVVVPLVARGRKLGVICFAWLRSRATTMAADLEVAKGLSDRAAVAIDNARLYQEAQEAARVREDVVAIVSHDLRNPLNAITLSAATLLKREDVDERTAKAIRRIYAAADRASGMIRDLLDFTQARVGGIPIHRRPLDFHEHVHRVVDEVQGAHPERHIDFHARGDGQGEWDEGRLAQVVTNLVGNALQHSPASTPVRVSTWSEGPGVCLEVHNEGAPIPAELLPTLFEPYRQGPEAGTGRGSLGLGLFITRQIVLGHGGTLDVRSTGDDGTTFTVRLPRHRH